MSTTSSAPTSNRMIDWITVFLLIGLLAIGWLMLYASVYNSAEEINLLDIRSPIGSQSMWLVISLVGFWLVTYIDWKLWHTFAYPIYGIALALLIGVLLFGMEVKGARSWYRIGAFSFQPSEVAKLATCFAMASFLGNFKTDLRRLNSQLAAFGIMLFPAVLILLQPDAGSGLIFFSFMILLYREGLSPIYYQVGGGLVMALILTIMFNPWICISVFLFIGAIIYAMQLERRGIALLGVLVMMILTVVLWTILPAMHITIALFIIFLGMSFYLYTKRFPNLISIMVPAMLFISMVAFGTNYFFNNILKPHQQDRIKVWLKPQECDPQGALYNINQSKTAIGSGGLLGKGFLQGIMTEGNHVPEQTTDFIFSTLGEEQGFIGVFSVILLYFLLMYRILIIGERARHLFVRRYAYGVLGILFFHFFINIGMTMGLAPVIGIPLPFISKGGTSMFFFAIMLGILVKMDMSRIP